MAQGQVVMEGDPAEVGGSADLLASYLGTSHAAPDDEP